MLYNRYLGIDSNAYLTYRQHLLSIHLFLYLFNTFDNFCDKHYY